MEYYSTTLRHCPICGSTEAELLTSIEFLPCLSNPLPDHYYIAACAGCGFVFNDTEAKQQDFDNYYSRQSKYASQSISGPQILSPYERLRFEKICDHIKSQFSEKAINIIDVGSAQGGLLKCLQAQGYNNLFAIDPSADRLSQAPENQLSPNP